ncbi:protein kinase subdomain-containing protein [Botrytis cinerea]
MTPLSNIIVVSALTEDLKCGQYAIECTEQCDVLVENATKTKFWFDSKSLSDEVIRRISSVRLITESHDQGHVDTPYGGNWTWFELRVRRGSTSGSQEGGKNLYED